MFDNGQDPLDPEQETGRQFYQGAHQGFHFNPFGGGGGGGGGFKFHFGGNHDEF